MQLLIDTSVKCKKRLYYASLHVTHTQTLSVDDWLWRAERGSYAFLNLVVEAHEAMPAPSSDARGVCSRQWQCHY